MLDLSEVQNSKENWIQKSLPSLPEIERLFDLLWPIPRSLTGPGFRQSLDILKSKIPFVESQVPSGKKVFDWTVPKEWRINAAWILTPDGQKICDFSKNNLHVVGYSTPVNRVIDLETLQKHLHSLPDLPKAIPYITSYYQERWGFCISDEQRKALKPGNYTVFIDSQLMDGHVTLGEAVLPSPTGSSQEILLSTYLCHPSMANNELSGPLVQAFLYTALSKLPHRRFQYRFVCIPETIGAICYLEKQGLALKQSLVAGFVLTCCGDGGAFTYKKSRQGNSLADRATVQILSERAPQSKVLDFFPSGSDERQYCSPGFDLPVGSLMRTMYGTYPEYHTSLDNKEFISMKALQETVAMYLRIILTIEANAIYTTSVPYCEPMLGPRGLYPTIGQTTVNDAIVEKMLWLLNLCDGSSDILSIAQRSKQTALEMASLAEFLAGRDLLKNKI